MAASPINGDRPSGFRRSSSQFAALPQRTLSFHEKAGLAKGDAEADVLYSHPSIKIYSFSPPTDALRNLDQTKKTLPDADYPIDAIEILPWRSRTETLSAKGKLIIEKVQGSVHFLKAGDLIHTIMRNSQCWCVDGESKFVMRVSRLRYQRIEFPTAEVEERQKVDEFKEIIAKILKFEKTPCPFIRGFQVDLPEDAITPRRRGTWKRKESIHNVDSEESPQSARKLKSTRTMSMRGVPPTSFPSKSMSYLETERPRTASTPSSSARFSFPDVRTESPTNYISGEDNTDSDRPDSESDRPESSQHSEVEDSDREISTVPIIRSPLKNVQNFTSTEEFGSQQDHPGLSGRRASAVESQIKMFEKFKSKPPMPIRQRSSEFQFPPKLQEEIDTSSSLISKSAVNKDAVFVERGETDIQPVENFARNDNIEGRVERRLQSHSENNKPGRVKSESESSEITDTSREQIGETGSTVSEVPKDESPPSPPPVAAVADNETTDVEVHQPTISEQLPNMASSSAIIAAEPLSKTEIGTPTKDSQQDDKIKQNLETLQLISEVEDEPQDKSTINDDAESIVSTDSYHTMISDENLDQNQDLSQGSTGVSGSRHFQHRRELSEMTVTEASMGYEKHTTDFPDLQDSNTIPQDMDTAPAPTTPGSYIESGELRRRLKHRRSLSPLPPASILQPPSPSEHGSPIPAVLLQKAAAIAVVKPIEVVIFVVQVLARIAQGATMNDLISGDLFRRPGGPRRTASGTFENAIQPRGRSLIRDDADHDEENEDDFGMPILRNRRSSNKDESDLAEKDDVDDAASHASLD